MKFYNLSFGRVMEDDNQNSDLVAQVLNEVLAVVAPLNTAVTYSVYMVLCRDDESDDELVAYKVHSLIQCVEPESVSSEFHFMLVCKLYLRSEACTARLVSEI
jgi:hypothetical protein